MKLNFAAAAIAAFAFSAAPAQADTVTFSGDTTGADTYNRLVEDLSGKSTVGTAVAYDAYRFKPSVGGVYTFLSVASFDNFSFLYDAPFLPGLPSFHALIGNDDLGDATQSGFTYTLVADQAYFFVTTGYGNADFGSFTNTISGPAVSTVPEPQTGALLALGLLAIGWRCRAAVADRRA